MTSTWEEQAAPVSRPTGPPDFTELAAKLASLDLTGVPEGAFPEAELDVLRGSGYWGTGLDPEGPSGPDLLRLMRLVGRASLSLGRLFEGHVNALALIACYGSERQRLRATGDVQAGHLYGVWNTEGADPVRLLNEGSLRLEGAKTFASGGRRVTRPLLPVESEAGRQLVLLRADAPQSRVLEVAGSWEPMGMAATGSVRLDFSGSILQPDDLIGGPGDYYRQPMFSAGALRFCAVQLGGADRLLDEVRGYLGRLRRSGDDVQALRFAGCWTALQGAGFSVWEGERLEQALLHGQADEGRLLAQVDAARLATEDACLTLLEASERAVGARGLLEPEPFSRLIRDLRMYLRQPAPDAARLRLGHWLLAGDHEVEGGRGL